jgi:NitT/TauT family transport system substrate-binding protein
VSQGIDKATGKPLDVDLVTKSFKSITFTLDPLASTLKTDVDHAVALGILKSTPLTNIFDLSLLNKVLKDEGKAAVSS